MAGTDFLIRYLFPEEPTFGQAVAVATIEVAGHIYEVTLQPITPGEWHIQLGAASDRHSAASFNDALAAAHLQAYGYAERLTDTFGAR